MILVESSTIQGFEQKEENLIVEFKNGRKYEYEKRRPQGVFFC